jgi:salicylate hydroxylase
VVGLVIAGAVAALALARIGVRVDAFERTTGSVPVTRVETTDTETGLSSSFSRFEDTHRWPSTHVWRRDLLGALRARLERVGVRCHYGVAASAPELAADLIVGADGAWSVTRSALGNHHMLSFAGQVIRYGHHPRRVSGLPAGVLHFRRHQRGVAGYVGDDRDGSFWFSRYDVPDPALPVSESAMFASLLTTPVAGVVRESTVSESISLYELAPEGTWHNGRIVLIGDAAHAVSPAAGRGATSAIEDAAILAPRVARERDIESALVRYEAMRRPAARQAYRSEPGRPSVRVRAGDLTLSPATARDSGVDRR